MEANNLVRSAIMLAADSPEKLRPQDAWRVYDCALSMGVVAELKAVLRNLNPKAFNALCQYEGEEIEASIACQAFDRWEGSMQPGECSREYSR